MMMVVVMMVMSVNVGDGDDDGLVVDDGKDDDGECCNKDG